MSGSVLIVSATRAEARHLPSGSRLLVTGIGKVRATMALSRELAIGAPVRQIINIGTAGALRDGVVGPGRDLFIPSAVLEHDISSAELRAMGYDMTDRWDLPDGDGTVLASGDTFVADPVRRAELARYADLVDMEGCAVAHVSAQFGIPCRLVKAVTDNADEGAMEWPDLVDAAARKLGQWIELNV
ncbi:nucleosidase [Gordonia rubripertincta]|uniref:nucleosidase n=1 Tax=Gordonia rubripertincta TaxID=36822 RepID=UPI000B8D55BB|nr:nucleosidase [Gordonia rubripertincta]ASR04313.1 Aminodeoxyfutalosine nucleosidase [Gordonia rubripertincta]